MKADPKIAGRLLQINSDLGKIRSLRQLVRYIPGRSIEKAAFALLFLWNMAPLLAILRACFLDQGSDGYTQLMNRSMIGIVWLTVLQIAGSLGLMLGLVAFAQSADQLQSGHGRLVDYLRRHSMPLFLSLMLLWSFFSCLASGNIALTFYGTAYRQEGLAAYICYAGVFTSAYLIRNSRLLVLLLKIFTGIASFLSLLSVLNIGVLNTWFKMDAQTGIFYNANHYGYYLCLALMSTLYLVIRQDHPLYRLVHLACLVLITAALVQNQSLGPYLAVVLGFAIYIVLVVRSARKLIPRLAVSVGLFLGTTVVVNLITPSLLADLVRLWLDSKNIITGSDQAPLAGSNRWALWTAGLKFIASRPLFGFGPDNLGLQYQAAGIAEFDRPHNEIIQFAASLGIPALLFYLAALTAHFAGIWRKKWLTTPMGIGMFGILAAYLFSSLLGNTMYYTTPFFLMMLGMSGGLLTGFPPRIQNGVLAETIEKNIGP